MDAEGNTPPSPTTSGASRPRSRPRTTARRVHAAGTGTDAYNWGNPVGGKPRDNVGLFEEVNQNALAQLHTDGVAQDFNVWGSSSYAIGG